MRVAHENSYHDHSDDPMFRPPINRSMRVLDRSFFRKDVSLVAAKIQNSKQTQVLKSSLRKDSLKLARLQTIHRIRESDGSSKNALLLSPSVKLEEESTWSACLRQHVEADEVAMIPFSLQLDYDYWNYAEILGAILPEAMADDIPSGYSIVGHVGHLNLREDYLPYKSIIAAVLLDKDKNLRTIINKTEDVGKSNPFRTFNFEFLAGDEDLNVELSEEGCVFNFNYANVYWNSRLNTEHKRLVDLFQPGQAICDVMAGVGPFAVPAAKKRCWVYASDLNPDSWRALGHAVRRNKVRDFTSVFNEDGHKFIKSATTHLFKNSIQIDITPPLPRTERIQGSPDRRERIYAVRPRTFSHYVLNLPASALTFLPNFIGLYDNLGIDQRDQIKEMPLIHTYFFHPKTNDLEEVETFAMKEVSRLIGFDISTSGTGQLSVYDVRDVSPNKRMFCVSFQLPPEVAFRSVE